MSGHSKWHSIKHKKAATDAKRGKIFTKHAKLITVAAREGGGDPAMNASLRVAVDNAKAANMPNANIDRAIKKGTGELKDGAVIMEAMYEGFGPAGTAVLVQALTDNKNRSYSNIKTIFTKNGGNIGESGSVSWMFKKKGLITVELADQDPEELELAAIDAGAEDIKVEGEIVEVYTEPTELAVVRSQLEKAQITAKSSIITYVPDNTVKIEDVNEAKKILKFMDALDEDEDVGDVFSNFDISEAILEQCM